MVTVSWAGIIVIAVLYIIGWLIGHFRYTKNEAKHLGELIGKVEGLDGRMESLEKRMGNFEKRLDGLFTNRPGDVSD
ncbi:hypothetical protein ES703_58786 [subsurface metagenome]